MLRMEETRRIRMKQRADKWKEQVTDNIIIGGEICSKSALLGQSVLLDHLFYILLARRKGQIGGGGSLKRCFLSVTVIMMNVNRRRRGSRGTRSGRRGGERRQSSWEWEEEEEARWRWEEREEEGEAALQLSPA